LTLNGHFSDESADVACFQEQKKIQKQKNKKSSEYFENIFEILKFSKK